MGVSQLIKKKREKQLSSSTQSMTCGKLKREESRFKIEKYSLLSSRAHTQTIDEVEDEEFFEAPGVFSLYIQQPGIAYRTPKPSTCLTWNGNKIKTFDGVSYSHELACSHTMVQDTFDGSFSIILRACPADSVQPCPHALEIFSQSEQYTFENADGRVRMFTTKKEIPIPVQMAGLRVSVSGLDVRIMLDQIPITVTWDSQVNKLILLALLLC